MILSGVPEQDAQILIDEWQADGCDEREIRKLAHQYDDEATGQAILRNIGEFEPVRCPECNGVSILFTTIIREVSIQDKYGVSLHSRIETNAKCPAMCQTCGHDWK